MIIESYMIFSSNQSRVSLRIRLIVIIIVFVVIIVSIIAATGSLSNIIPIKYNSNQGATSSLIQEQTRTISYNEIVQYALKKINEDRSKFNVSTVKLSNDINNNNKTAAQLQAEDMLRTRQISHYTSDGMKPCMQYTIKK